MNSVYEIFRYLPNDMSLALGRCNDSILNSVTDVRLRVDCPTMVYSAGQRYFLTDKGLSENNRSSLCLFAEDAVKMLLKLSDSSLYAHDESIKRGYITTAEGHRVGLVGTAAVLGNSITGVYDIRGFYFRIARDVYGCCCKVAGLLTDPKGRTKNVIIISPPGHGKTTLLRDCARFVSEQGKKVCVVDERREISMSDSGSLPLCTVLNGYPKEEGTLIALRCLSPDVIVLDEIGGKEDADRITRGLWTGTSFFVTAHGSSISEVKRRPGFESIIPYFNVCLLPKFEDGNYTCGYEILSGYGT